MAENNNYHFIDDDSSSSDDSSRDDDSSSSNVTDMSVEEYNHFMWGEEMIRICDVVDVLLAPDMSLTYLRLFEVPTDHDLGWYWLATELAYMYLVLNNLPEGTHPISRAQLTPYNCWPGRSVRYLDNNDMILTWPIHEWAILRTSLGEIHLLGGIE